MSYRRRVALTLHSPTLVELCMASHMDRCSLSPKVTFTHNYSQDSTTTAVHSMPKHLASTKIKDSGKMTVHSTAIHDSSVHATAICLASTPAQDSTKTTGHSTAIHDSSRDGSRLGKDDTSLDGNARVKKTATQLASTTAQDSAKTTVQAMATHSGLGNDEGSLNGNTRQIQAMAQESTTTRFIQLWIQHTWLSTMARYSAETTAHPTAIHEDSAKTTVRSKAINESSLDGNTLG